MNGTPIAMEEREYPYAFVELAFPQGTRTDPVGLEGLTAVSAEMLLRGAGDLGYEAFQEAMETLGATLDTSVTRDGLLVSGETLTASRDAFVGLVRDALLRPRLDGRELQRVVRQFVAELDEVRDSDEELAQEAFGQILLAPDPAGRPVKGTAESLKRIRIADVRAHVKRLLVDDGRVVGSAGDLDAERLDAAFGAGLGLPTGAGTEPPPVAARTPQGIEVWLIDKPDRTQTQIVAGHLAPPIGHADHHALTVANTIFGGTFTARLSHEIREKRGWSYGAWSTYAATRELGSFVFRYYPAAKDALAALQLGLELLGDYAATGPTVDEVAFAQRYLGNQLPFRMETPTKRLADQIQCRLLGLPPDALARQLEAIAALDREAIAGAASRWLRPTNLSVAMVCTAADLADAVGRLPGVSAVHVVPYTAASFG